MKLKNTSRLLNKIGDDYAHFVCANIDDSASSPKYYGFTSLERIYLIMKEVSSSGVYTYTFYKMPSTKTISNYSTDWTNRASLSYQRYDLEVS